MRKLTILFKDGEVEIIIKALRKYIRECNSRENYSYEDEIKVENLLTSFENI